MKKIAVIALAAVLSICAYGCAQREATSASTNDGAKSSEQQGEPERLTLDGTASLDGFFFKYPTSWTLDETSATSLQVTSPGSGAIAILSCEDVDEMDAAYLHAAAMTTVKSFGGDAEEVVDNIDDFDLNGVPGCRFLFDTTIEDTFYTMHCALFADDDQLVMFVIGYSKSDLAGLSETIFSSLGYEEPGGTENGAEGAIAKDSFLDALTLMGEFEEQTINGSGDDVVDDPCAGTICLMTIEHSGSRHFSVAMLNEDGDQIELLVNTTGSYSGTVTNQAAYKKGSALEINADGGWSISFKPMSAMEPIENGEIYHGDDVRYIEADTDRFSIANSGDGHFSVRAIGMAKSDLLVNTTDSYSGTVAFNDTPCYLIVDDDDGDWSVSWE